LPRRQILSGEEKQGRAYAEAGYAPNRGNAARLAADPRIKAIAQAQCRDALERNGLQVEYLQANQALNSQFFWPNKQ
jgi:hypothetical protein